MRSLKRITLDDFRGRLRGFGFGDIHAGPMSVEAYDILAATGANNVRTAFVPAWDGQAFVLPAQQLATLQAMLPQLQARKIYATLLMALPEAEHIRIWTDKNAMLSLVAIWRMLAKSLRGRTVVAGFDLLNEPKMTNANNAQAYWDGFVKHAVSAVAAEDPLRIPIVSTWPGGVCMTNPEWGEWLRFIPGCVLTAHNYSPFEFTHQGYMDWTTPGLQYDPYMHTTLQAQQTAMLWLRDFSLKTGMPIWIGESSCQQDKPGGAEYALHFTQLCEAYRFSGSWHYFLGWPAWHPNEAALTHLKAWFARA